MPSTSPLSLPARSAIVLIALLQGLMLYAAQELSDAWPFRDIGWRYCWYAWVLAIPSAVALSLLELRQRRLWLQAALGSAVVLLLAAWIGWNLEGETALASGALQFPLTVGIAVAVFVALPWWQFQLQHGHWRASYPALFERAWQNGLTLALAALFTGLTWLLLWLWAALFQLLDVTFFRDLFRQDAFIALATGSLAGFGVLIGRTQHRAIQITRQVLFAICRGLLPLLSFIAVLFVLSLPLTGLEPLWKTRSAASLLLVLSLLLVSFTNAVYQQGDDTPPYPVLLRRLVEASLLALPVYAGLALYALGLRVAQYGWTVERVWAVLIALAVAGYAVGYALAVLRRQGRWLQMLEPVNRGLCWAVLALALLGNSPLLDPVRLTLSSQLARLRADPAAITPSDVNVLRFDLGRRGVQALRALQDDPAIRADANAPQQIADALARTSRWDAATRLDKGPQDVAALQRALKLAKGSRSPPADWWQALATRTINGESCAESERDCLIVHRDLDADGSAEVLLCELYSHRGPDCVLYARGSDTHWHRAGSLFGAASGQAAAINQALRDGEITLVAPRWPMLSIGGRPALAIDPEPESNESSP
ncbi:DUF4153 domain-containing protein [Stenotrophomonas maltophilia]